MHENRHFPSYRKCRHDAENHVHISVLRNSGESLQNGRVTDLEKICTVFILRAVTTTDL